MVQTTGIWNFLGTCPGQPDIKQWLFPLTDGKAILLEVPEPYKGRFWIAYGEALHNYSWSTTYWRETRTDVPASKDATLTDQLVSELTTACLVRAHARLVQDAKAWLSSAEDIKRHIIEIRPTWTLSAVKDNFREYQTTLADGTTVTLSKEGPNSPWKARHDRGKSNGKSSALVIYSDLSPEDAQERAEEWATGHIRKL